MFGLNNKGKTNNSNIVKSEPVKVESKGKDPIKLKDNKSFINSIIQDKKNYLPKDTLTREEVLKEIEKQFQKKGVGDTNPFKTRDDRYFLFYNSNMQLNRQPVPFEELKIGGKTFFINKKFENGRIVIEQLFGSPDIEIDIKAESNKIETTKRQLEKINQYILFIKNKIAKGEEKYDLIDIEDLKEEKFRLEKIIESCKYGKHAIFDFQDPITNKKAYMLRYSNGEYKYLKITENNFITEENNIKFLKGYDILKKLEDIANLRISRNWKEIFLGLFIIFISFMAVFGSYKLMTFEESLFDQRVQEYAGEQIKFYQDQVKDYKTLQCELKDISKPFDTEI